ncbi:ras and Rab interactor 1 [Erythrolamprus reginae]|uniref:ras and Rab interactor 1 n=1 Tax=Erythrolamprus reginae TaxID=121349 RepID=UPI00396CADD0
MVNAAVYREILEHFMLPSVAEFYGDGGFIFQQDLAPVHPARSTKTGFNDHLLFHVDPCHGADSPPLAPAVFSNSASVPEDLKEPNFHLLTRMTSNPAYDYPEPYANPRQGAVSLPSNISLVGRLRLTQPVWLQLGINSAAALHILQREPAGTFLVRRSNTRQCQVLCLRLLNGSSPAFVTTYLLHQERAAVTLEGSDQSFPTLLHLIASYCSVPDVLPLALRLPQPIWEASTCQELEAIAHLGLEFWNSSLNAKGSVPLASLGSPLGTDLDSTSTHPLRDTKGLPRPTQAPGLPTTSADDPSLEDVGARRQYFKSNIKVQVSTEAASPLSPPAAPPPPIPVFKKKKKTPPRPTQPPASGGGSQFSNGENGASGRTNS